MARNAGAELGLLRQHQGKNRGIKFKYQDAPKLTKSMHQALADLALHHLWVIYPGDKTYALSRQVTVLPLGKIEWMLEI